MLSDLQRKKLPNLFHLHDKDRDGALRREDYVQFPRELAQARGFEIGSPEEQELSARFLAGWESLSDFRVDGGVSLDGWLAYWERVLTTDGLYEQFAGSMGEFIFLLLDANGDGTVGRDEFLDFYRAYDLSEEESLRLFDRLDLDGSGSLSRDEIEVLLRQYFLSDDPDAPGNVFFGPYEDAHSLA